LGKGLDEIRTALVTQATGLSNVAWHDCSIETWLGRVCELDDHSLQSGPEWRSRNNHLAQLGITQDNFVSALNLAGEKYRPERIGLIIGTSTSSIGRTESAYRELAGDGRFTEEYRQPYVHNPYAPTAFLAEHLKLAGPTMTISTACTSSAKALGAGARWLTLGLADAIVVGGVDSLCRSVINGFHSLQLVDKNQCRPFDSDRKGINLGEAAGFMLLTKEPLTDTKAQLLGYGESSDAYHMSSAHPDGLGAELAITKALERSGLKPDEIDYVNLHGTGTKSNDDIEALIQRKLLPSAICSSTKSWTGHTLGAAGICEAILTVESILTGLLPGTLNTQNPEPQIAGNLLLENTQSKVDIALSNSFGFGGNNCSLIFGAA